MQWIDRILGALLLCALGAFVFPRVFMIIPYCIATTVEMSAVCGPRYIAAFIN